MERKLQSDHELEILRSINRAIAGYIQAVLPGLPLQPSPNIPSQDTLPIKLENSYFIERVSLFSDGDFCFNSEDEYKKSFGLVIFYRQDVPENFVRGNFSGSNLAERSCSLFRFSLEGDQSFLHPKVRLDRREMCSVFRNLKMEKDQLLERATPLRSKIDRERIYIEGEDKDWYELIHYVLYELHRQDPVRFPNPAELFSGKEYSVGGTSALYIK